MLTSRFINFFLAFILLNVIVIFLVNSEVKKRKVLSFIGCIMSVMLVVSLCFFPLPMQEELIESIKQNGEGLINNFVPFHTIVTTVWEAVKYRAWSSIIYQLFGNIILFIPFAVSLHFYLHDSKKKRRMLICILFLSCTIEAMQGLFNFLLGVNYRVVDIDDIILNVIGGVLGGILASYAEEQFIKVVQKKKAIGAE
ncbi:hypothetical protein FACS1894111_04090 [Clostridia bacterium]|nr:hypothetical protein FACS1894111_04090 [Clostridia bacterium]